MGGYTAYVGVISPKRELHSDVLQPGHGLRPAGVPALCGATSVPDEFVQEATEGAKPAPLHLVRSMYVAIRM